MKIISKRQREIIKTYHRSFQFKDDDSRGFSFDCDENGKVKDHHELDVQRCISDKRLNDCGVVVRERTTTIAAVGECDCGAHVHLTGFTNTCACGADYNMTGSRLASRSQWGEETGESPSDIINSEARGFRDAGYDY